MKRCWPRNRKSTKFGPEVFEDRWPEKRSASGSNLKTKSDSRISWTKITERKMETKMLLTQVRNWCKKSRLGFIAFLFTSYWKFLWGSWYPLHILPCKYYWNSWDQKFFIFVGFWNKLCSLKWLDSKQTEDSPIKAT